MSRTTFVAACLLAVAVARADDDWTLTTADFKTEAAAPTVIDHAAVTVAGASGDSKSVPLASFVQLSRPSKPEAPKGLVLCVAGGQRLVGTPRKLDGGSVVWFTTGVGDVAVPVESVLAVLRDRTTAGELADPRAEDQAKLATGDVVHGILTDITGDAFVFTPAAGDPVTVPAASVASVFFASPPGGRAAVAPPAFTVRVAGGSVVAAKDVSLAAGHVHLDLGSRSADVPLAQVNSIERTGGTVAWLSAREPASVAYTPFLDGRFVPQFDRSVTGGPVRFGATTYAHGIGVHSRTKLVYAVQPGDRTFRTRYAVDGNLPFADVDVAVYLDGERVHAKAGVRAGELSPLVEVPLGTAKTLTLEVDYGQNYDVQDRLNWIEPAIVRAP